MLTKPLTISKFAVAVDWGTILAALPRQNTRAMQRSDDNFLVTNRATGTVFQVQPGEAVLAAAHRQGIHLAYSCLNGTCAACKAQVIEGEWGYPLLPAEALEPGEAEAGLALLCQAVPRSDLTIVAREPAALKDIVTRVLPTRVAEISFPNPEVALVRLRLPKGMRLPYLAGQYLDVMLADGKRRAFSIAGAPAPSSGTLELHVRRVPGGGFTERVFTTLKVGDLLRIEAPLGTFFVRERSLRSIICVAGGTGFAPIKAIVEQLLADEDFRPLQLYWGARNRSDLYLDELARGWAERFEHIRYTPVLSDNDDPRWSGRTGLVHEAVIHDHDDLWPFDVYMSGPPVLIDVGRHAFAEHGLPERHLYYDSFEFAPDVRAIRGSPATEDQV